MDNNDFVELNDYEIQNMYSELIESPVPMIAAKCSYGCYCYSSAFGNHCAPCGQCSE